MKTNNLMDLKIVLNYVYLCSHKCAVGTSSLSGG